MRSASKKLVKMNLKGINTSRQDMEFGDEGMHDVHEIVMKLIRRETIPPMVITRNGYLIDGRHRYLAYKRMGIKEVIVEVRPPKRRPA